jgi:hypothetical protein
MSINYYGVATDDPKRIGAILEGTANDSTPIEGEKIRAALAKRGFKGKPNATMKWEAGSAYVFVDVLRDHALVTHNSSDSSIQIEFIMDAIATLQAHGLKVWDPQQGRWFPGS